MAKYEHLLNNQHAKGNKPNKTSFKKGSTPWNKNKKGIHLSPATEFKKGQKGINCLPVSVITIRTEKSGKKRHWIKVSEPNKWIEYAKFIWIRNSGEIQKGLLIHHIDKDSLNDVIENLALVTRAAHINLHRAELRIAINTGVPVKEQRKGQLIIWQK